MAIKEYNVDLDIKGRVLATDVPNSTGSIVTWNATTNVFGLRTNAQILSDLSLSSNFVPYTGATANVNLGTRSITTTGGFLGNATTATTLATARTLTIGGTGKTFNGSANVSWSLSEILTAGSNITISGNTISATNTNTTYTAGNGLTLSGTAFSLPITTTGTGTFVKSVTQTTNGLTVDLGTPTTYDNMTSLELEAGVETEGRVISAKTLNDWMNQPVPIKNIITDGDFIVTENTGGGYTFLLENIDGLNLSWQIGTTIHNLGSPTWTKTDVDALGVGVEERIDVVYYNDVGGITYIKGSETEASYPNIPTEAILRTFVLITSDGIEIETDKYLEKKDLRWKNHSDTFSSMIFGSTVMNYRFARVLSTGAVIMGSHNEPIYDGAYYTFHIISDATGEGSVPDPGDMTFRHMYTGVGSANYKFDLPNGEDITITKGQTITFKYMKASGVYVLVSISNGSASVGSYWEKTGDDIHYNSGNVGIGTTNPQYLLDIVNNGTGQMVAGRFVNNNSNGTILFKLHNNTGTGINNGAQFGLYGSNFSGLGDAFVFWNWISTGIIRLGVGTQEGFVLDSNGDVKLSTYTGVSDGFIKVDNNGTLIREEGIPVTSIISGGVIDVSRIGNEVLVNANLSGYISEGADSEETIKHLSIREEESLTPDVDTIYFIPKLHQVVREGQLSIAKYPGNTGNLPQLNDKVEGFMKDTNNDIWYVVGRYLGTGSHFDMTNYELMNGTTKW